MALEQARLCLFFYWGCWLFLSPSRFGQAPRLIRTLARSLQSELGGRTVQWQAYGRRSAGTLTGELQFRLASARVLFPLCCEDFLRPVQGNDRTSASAPRSIRLPAPSSRRGDSGQGLYPRCGGVAALPVMGLHPLGVSETRSGTRALGKARITAWRS
jgi:hypothetical protein